MVRSGFEYWERLLGKKLFFENTKCGMSDYFIPSKKKQGIAIVTSDLPEYVIRNNKKVALWAEAPTATFLEDGSHSNMIVFYPMWSYSDNEDARNSVVRHEIGHVLGFGHTLNKRCLMYEVIELNEGLKGACLQEIKKFQELYK